MKIKGGIKVYLIVHIIVTALICALLAAMFMMYYTTPHTNSIIHNLLAGEGEFDEYALLISLVLRVFHYWAFLKRHWSFRVLFFMELILNIVVMVTAEYPEISITLLVIDAPLAVYLLFSKAVRQFAPFPFQWKSNFENWMFSHMAMDKFPTEDTENYLQEFQKAQDNQYVQWKYPLAGQRAPLDEARGSALLYSFAFFGTGAIALTFFIALLADWSSSLDSSNVLALVIMIFFSIVSFFIGWRYVQLHYRRKYVAKMRRAEHRRKRSKYKADKDG